MEIEREEIRLTPEKWGDKGLEKGELEEVVSLIGGELKGMYPEISDWSDSQRYRAWLAFMHDTGSQMNLDEMTRDNGYLLFIYSRRFFLNVYDKHKGDRVSSNYKHNVLLAHIRKCGNCGLIHIYNIALNCVCCNKALNT